MVLFLSLGSVTMKMKYSVVMITAWSSSGGPGDNYVRNFSVEVCG